MKWELFRIKKIISLFCIRLVILWLWVGISQYAYAIEIEPMRLELELNATQTHEGSLKLTNHSSEPIEASLATGMYRFVMSPNIIYPEIKKTTIIDSCQQWIKLTPDLIKIQPGSTEEIQYTIDIPSDSFGEYVAAIVVDENRLTEALDPATKGQVRVKITPRFSIPVYVAIKDSLEYSAEITEFEPIYDAESGVVNFEVTIKNTGTAHIRPVGTIVITDQKNNLAARLSTGRCLPIFSEWGLKIPVRWASTVKGKYTAVATLDIGTGELLQKTIQFNVE